MPDRRLEDKISVEDLMKKPQKELLTMIYLQACKIKGQVAENIRDIQENRLSISKLQDKCDMFISTKGFAVGATILGFIIILFNVLNYFVR